MDKKQVYIVVALILNDKKEILLAKRDEPTLPNAHNKWEFIGGGIDFGETPLQALKREVKEEAGIEVEVVRLLPEIQTHVWDMPDKQEQIIIISYECKVVGGELKPNVKENVGELKFFPVSEIPTLDCLPNVKEITDLLSR